MSKKQQENPLPETDSLRDETIKDAVASELTDSQLIDKLQEAVAQSEANLAEITDKYLRLMAEFDNFRRRSQKEKQALYEDSIADVVKQWLPVLDNLDRAELSAAEYESDEAVKIAEGIALIRRQAFAVLDKLGVETIECCGGPFDPNLHDAVMHTEDDAYGASTVIEEFKKGYKRKDRVLRHSVVKVAN